MIPVRSGSSRQTVSEQPHLLDYIKSSPLAQDLTERDCGLLETVMTRRTLEKDQYWAPSPCRGAAARLRCNTFVGRLASMLLF